jgi:hypothetical protein
MDRAWKEAKANQTRSNSDAYEPYRPDTPSPYEHDCDEDHENHIVLIGHENQIQNLENTVQIQKLNRAADVDVIMSLIERLDKLERRVIKTGKVDVDVIKSLIKRVDALEDGK